MFTKLNFNHTLTAVKPGKELFKFGKTFEGKFHGIAYYDVDANTNKQLLYTLPEPLRKYFKTTLMIINIPEVPPHIDNEIKLVINYYIKTARATTTFYNIATSKPNIEKLPNQTDGAILDPNDLTPIGNFTANAGEVWALDVKRPHSVSCSKTEDRIAYCVQTYDIGFNDFVEILKENNLV